MAEEKSDPFDAVGVGRFAKDVAVLAVPMGLVATVFGIWMNAKVAEFKQMVGESIEKHVTTERATYNAFVQRGEFEAYRTLQEERHANDVKESEEQTRMIRRNTVLLERIATKVGVARQGGD